MTGDRMPCINPRCRRTAPYEPGLEIICGKCWRTLPQDIRDRRRHLERRLRTIRRRVQRRQTAGTIAPDLAAEAGQLTRRLLNQQWDEIKQRFYAPPVPVGLENFLREVGL